MRVPAERPPFGVAVLLAHCATCGGRACAEAGVPFNVQDIGGEIYVTFAQQDSAKHDEVDGPGLGYAAIFSPWGQLLRRLEHGPWLNGPWGLVMASGDFGPYSHDLLVGQFGSGNIAVYDPPR